MINLRILFGLVPKTSDYEAQQESLRKEYLELAEFAKSPELKEYQELENTVKSPDFARKKKSILSQKYSDTTEWTKEKEYLRLKKQREIRKFYQIKNSIELKDFLEFDKSYDVKHYHTLEKLIHSDEWTSKKRQLGKKFTESSEYQQYLEYKNLKNSKRFRDYFAFKTSRDYVNFTLLIGSEKINAFENLEKYIRSEDFIKIKEYMLLPGQKKYEMSPEFQLEKKYLELRNSEKIRWYYKVKDSKKFDEIKRWELTFSDDFETNKLDRKKWLSRYFWGDAMLHESYSLDNEKQFYNEDKNIEMSGSTLTIITRREKVRGKAWNASVGFFPRDFNYTSSIINTGHSFRQKYGLFEAKIRFNANYPVTHAFWLVSDTMLPHVNIVRAADKISMGNLWGSAEHRKLIRKNESRISLSRYGSDYFIYSMEWSAHRLTWKINGVTVNSVTEGVPQVPMYINLSSALYAEIKDGILPALLEVDWIRCYRQTV